MLWAMWAHFQGGSLCLTSSVCWFFRLTSSVALWEGGCCKQIALSCARSVSALLDLSLFACAQTTPALRCSAGNRLGPALGCVHFPGPSRSGSALRQPSEAQIQLGLRFVPFPGLSSSGAWRARSPRLVTFSAAAAQLFGWTTGTPREADCDCPAPPEVLAKKPACS